MIELNEKRRIAQEVYDLTGMAVPDDDPILIAAFYYTQKMQATARDAAKQINMAGASTRAVVDAASALVEKATANNKVLADALELRVKKAMRDAGYAQPSGDGPPKGWRGILAGIAFGAVAALGVIGVACNFSFSWIEDAALGRVLKVVYPTLSPASQAEWAKQVEKLQPR